MGRLADDEKLERLRWPQDITARLQSRGSRSRETASRDLRRYYEAVDADLRSALGKVGPVAEGDVLRILGEVACSYWTADGTPDAARRFMLLAQDYAQARPTEEERILATLLTLTRGELTALLDGLERYERQARAEGTPYSYAGLTEALDRMTCLQPRRPRPLPNLAAEGDASEEVAPPIILRNQAGDEVDGGTEVPGLSPAPDGLHPADSGTTTPIGLLINGRPAAPAEVLPVEELG